MLRELMRLWPRVRGQGWEKAKIHKQLHVPDDIERTGPTEHNHIRLVKRPAKGTQQRAKVFDRQLGQRVSDAYIVDMAYQWMATPYDPQPQALSSLVQIFMEVSLQASKGWLMIESNPAQPYFGRWKPAANQDPFSAEMDNFLIQHYASLPVSLYPLKLPGRTNVYLCTEYKQAGASFCGHADYPSMGPWYNWVMLRWAREDN
jgi:hypothetical protein